VLRARDHETRTLAACIEDARGGRGQALVVRGEAGVGKTALLEWAHSAADGFRVLRASGTEFEMELPFAGLHALCQPLLGARGRLPDPQRETLETAFGLRADGAHDPLLAGMAVLTLLSDAAAEAPLLCLIDDTQWVDQASAQAVAFAARRLANERILMLLGTRQPAPAGVLAALPALTVDPLPHEVARALLLAKVDGPLDERVLDRILAEARGNPLVIEELATSAGELAGGFAVPAGPSSAAAEALFRRRLEALPEHTRTLMLVGAAEPLGDPVLLWRAAERLGLDALAAAPAEAAGLLELGARVRFRHPLVRSAIYRPAAPGDRRRVHAALADATDARAEPDRRAWHRAQAASGPDEALAADLVLSARRARDRGGVAAAAAFVARAVELTPEPSARLDRLLLAAELQLDAGRPEAALDLLRTADPEAGGPPAAARADGLRGRIAFSLQRGADAPPLLRRAAQRLEPLDPRAARDLHLDALFAAVHVGAFGTAPEEAASLALGAVPPSGPPTVADLLLDGIALVLAGRREAGTVALKAALAGPDDELLAAFPPVIALVCLELWDLDTYVDVLGRDVAALDAEGALTALPQALGPLGGGLLPLGRLRAAEELLDRAEALAGALGTAPPYPRIHLAALRGDVATGQALIDAVIADAGARGEGQFIDYARFAEALLHNGAGDYARALHAAQEGAARRPFAFAGLALRELVEAGVRGGERAAAQAALPALIERTQASGTLWARGIEASCRALLADGAEAETLHRSAIEHLARGGLDAELGRAELLHGEWLRREGRRREARARLTSAYERLSTIGAAGFAERARRELSATGARARRRTVDTADELTPQELHIARLVATGATSKEVAAELFVSPRTVDAHLRSIFRKLGITSRRELRRIALASG
jgi:DNA-binding CsgD family transcriptional regulator